MTRAEIGSTVFHIPTRQVLMFSSPKRSLQNVQGSSYANSRKNTCAGSPCMVEVFWCMLLTGSSRQTLPEGCTVDPSWRTADGEKKKNRGRKNCQPPGLKKLANGISVNGLGAVTGRKERLRDHTYGHNIKVRNCVWRSCFNKSVATEASGE